MKSQDFVAVIEHSADVMRRFAGLVHNQAVFYGRGPFEPDELAKLHPQPHWVDVVADGDIESAVNVTPSTAVLVLGNETPTDDAFEILLCKCSDTAVVLSQAGFLALALFGEDWWNDARPDRPGRGDMAHPFGAVKEVLANQGDLCWPEETNERWWEGDDSSTAQGGDNTDDTEGDDDDNTSDDEDEEEGDEGEEQDDDWVPDPVSLPYRPSDHPEPHPTGADTNFRNTTVIRGKYGYQVTGMTEAQRWRALAAAVAGEGLKAVVEELTSLPRVRKLQVGGRERYAHAIGVWELDLVRLKRVYFKGDFGWPATEP